MMALPTDTTRAFGRDGLTLVGRIVPNLDLLADLTHADVLLFVRAGDRVAVAAHARPEPVPSLYPQPLTNRLLKPEQIAPVSRLLFHGRPRHQLQGAVVSGVPIARETFAIADGAGRVVAALVTETAAIEQERLRKRETPFRRAITRVRELVTQGRLHGGENIGRLGIHDGLIVIDAGGEIQYVTAVAEGLYRLLGYADSLVHTQLSELDTNEYPAFRAMELGVCLEQRVTEQDQIWIKKVVPLVPDESHGWRTRLPGRASRSTGAIIIIQDVTDEVRKEQELRVKSAMIQEIHHRVKNNLQTISALLRLQARRTASPEVAEILKQTVSRILSVAVVHEFLSKDESSVINIHEVANRILQEVTHGTLDPTKQIRFTLEGANPFLLPAQQATSCALIINELLQNAVEHGYEGRDRGLIAVRLLQTDDSMAVEIDDDGQGLPPGFDPQRGGLGLQIVHTLVKEDLKGQFQVIDRRQVGDTPTPTAIPALDGPSGSQAGDGATRTTGVRAVASFPRWYPPAALGLAADGAGAAPPGMSASPERLSPPRAAVTGPPRRPDGPVAADRGGDRPRPVGRGSGADGANTRRARSAQRGSPAPPTGLAAEH